MIRLFIKFIFCNKYFIKLYICRCNEFENNIKQISDVPRLQLNYENGNYFMRLIKKLNISQLTITFTFYLTN